MKTNKILSAFAMAAVTLGFTACADTDAQYSIPDVDSPKFVASTPEMGAGNVKRGDVTVTVKYDKRVFFATQDKNKIAVTGGTLTNAIVYGTDSMLTMTVNCPERGAQVSVTVPEGVVTNGQGKPAAEVTVNFSTVDIDKNPVMAKSSAAIKLYDYLAEMLDNKIISGMMADVAWTHGGSDQVFAWTGKYPAINGYDYIHMPASEAGANWINYMDITPVKEWADAGGIVTLTWHWLVPKALQDGVVIPGDWSGYVQLVSDNVKNIMKTAAVGDRLVVTISDVAEGAQGSIKNSSWTGFVDESGTSWEYFDISGDSYEMVLDATVLADIQANGFILSGHDYTVTGVYLVPAGADVANGIRIDDPLSSLDPNTDYTYVPDETAFDAANALVEGTWENEIWKRDMTALKKYLTLLKEAGIPVLWRPFHEASGQWFWWGKDADTFKKLWLEMFGELNAAGLDNLIWVWTSCGKDNDWYPGDAYVDVVARDLYGETAATCVSEYSDLGATYGNKIITLGECGWSEYANNNEGGRIATITEQWNAGAKWSWFMPWYDGSEAVNKHADEEWWQDAMSNPNVVTREQLPVLK